MDIRSQVNRLIQDSWHSRDYPLTGCQAYIRGTLIALPFATLACGLYRDFLLERAVLPNCTGAVLPAVIAVSLSLHELLHGLGWKLAGRLEPGGIHFLFQCGMPLCACGTVLSAKAYLAGLLLPFLMLGGSSMAFLIIYPGTVSMLAALVNFLLPGTDLLIAWKILRSGASKIARNPDQAGFTGLFPPTKHRS